MITDSSPSYDLSRVLDGSISWRNQTDSNLALNVVWRPVALRPTTVRLSRAEVTLAATEESSIRVEVLGGVRAWRGGEELDVGPHQQRAVLGVLATRVNRPVSRSELIDA